MVCVLKFQILCILFFFFIGHRKSVIVSLRVRENSYVEFVGMSAATLQQLELLYDVHEDRRTRRVQANDVWDKLL